MRRRYVHDGAASGWQLMGCVISLMSTFKLVSATGNSRRQSRTPKKFRMHLSAAASSPGFVDDVHASLAPVPQALALPCEQTLLQAKMPGMMQPLATALHSELSCLFVHSMLQTVRRPANARRCKAAARNAGHGRRTARRARVGHGTATDGRKARRRIGGRLQTGLLPVCMRSTQFDPSTLRLQIQVGLRASCHVRTARGREAETPASTQDSCCEGTRSVCIQPKTMVLFRRRLLINHDGSVRVSNALAARLGSAAKSSCDCFSMATSLLDCLSRLL